MSGHSWIGSQPTEPVCPQAPPSPTMPACLKAPRFPAATHAQPNLTHHNSIMECQRATSTPAPLHESTPGSQHHSSTTSRTPVPSPFLEPQQPPRSGSNPHQWGPPPPLQPTAAQVVMLAPLSIILNTLFWAARRGSGPVSGEVRVPLLRQAGRQV